MKITKNLWPGTLSTEGFDVGAPLVENSTRALTHLM